MELGRIVGRNVTEAKFRCPYGEYLALGEIVVVEDAETAEPYYLRVFNITYGAEASGDDWFERTAGHMLAMDGAEMEYGFADKERRLYKLASASVLGVLRDGNFRRAKGLVAHFSGVRRARDADFEFLPSETLTVGRLRSGDEPLPHRVGLAPEALPYHIGIFATTGMGKSNLLKCFCASALESGQAGLLVLDPHGEYFDGGVPDRRGLVHHPRADRLAVYSSRPLSGNYSQLRLSASEVEVRDLLHLYDFSGPQREALNAARQRYQRNWLVELNERNAEQVSEELHGEFHPGTIGVIKRRLRYLWQFDLLSSDPDVTASEAIIAHLDAGKVVLVDTSNMFETEELLVSMVLARAVFESHKAKYAQPKEFAKLPPVLVTLEESQRLLSETRGNVFAQIAREGRKFRVGLCAVSQQPKLLHSEVLSQFNTLFVMGLADRRDRESLQASAKQDLSRLDMEIQTLAAGEAILTSPHVPFALPIAVDLYEDYLQALPPPEEQPQRASDDGFF